MNYNFSAEKNSWLMMERGISFDEVVEAVEADEVLDVYKLLIRKNIPTSG
jgi:hypothetical protein